LFERRSQQSRERWSQDQLDPPRMSSEHMRGEVERAPI
jgi:hypothetical protein